MEYTLYNGDVHTNVTKESELEQVFLNHNHTVLQADVTEVGRTRVRLREVI